ncbi:MAG TPA: methionine aminotransferase [Catalimonadaceae bacterium]|nr:methionine aminotransferase [Catalimonadaceae bacterium]
MPPVPIQSKLPKLPQTIFSTMTQLANQHKAINLGQGFPDFEMSEKLKNLVSKAMNDGFNQYAHTNGYQGLREVLAAKVEALYGNSIDAETEITITPGGTYALSNTFTALLGEGDEVIVFEPCFDSYLPNIKMSGGVPVCIPLNFPDYSIPWEKVREAFSQKTRFILLNSPHNPSGAVLSESDIENLRNLVSGTNCLILSDEVYEHLIFDGMKHLSILKYPDLFERSLVAFSLGKVFHCTGWKIGYCIAPEYLMQEFRNHHQFNVFSVNTPAQVAMATYLEDPSVYLDLWAIFQTKRDLFLSLIKDLPFKPIPSHGSYFQCLAFENGLADTDTEMALKLVKDIGVASIPVSAFYQNRTDNLVLRFCFAKKEETLIEAARRLHVLESQ